MVRTDVRVQRISIGCAPRPCFASDGNEHFCGMTHGRTSPFYPQSNGKLDRWHQSLKTQALRPNTPLSTEDNPRIVGHYVTHYNTVRLHSAIGYITPKDKLQGQAEQIFAARDRKLEAARETRRQRRAGTLGDSPTAPATPAQPSPPPREPSP